MHRCDGAQKAPCWRLEPTILRLPDEKRARRAATGRNRYSPWLDEEWPARAGHGHGSAGSGFECGDHLLRRHAQHLDVCRGNAILVRRKRRQTRTPTMQTRAEMKLG